MVCKWSCARPSHVPLKKGLLTGGAACLYIPGGLNSMQHICTKPPVQHHSSLRHVSLATNLIACIPRKQSIANCRGVKQEVELSSHTPQCEEIMLVSYVNGHVACVQVVLHGNTCTYMPHRIYVHSWMLCIRKAAN